MQQALVLFFLAAVAIASCASASNSPKDLPRRANCGGSTTSDSSSLTFPVSPDEGDFLLPGEACVWTVHLETTRNFIFNLINYSDNSTSSDCSDGGIRIYSLTNLVPVDKIQSYTFCSGKPPPDNFFLNENVAVVVLYASGNSSTPVYFKQFSLNWEGSSFDPVQTKHVTSFSSVSSGVIRYPAIGQYEASLAATWVINSESNQNAPTRTDFLMERLELQSCTNPDPCTCDALILYSISSSGVLGETQRFCSDSADVTLQGVESRFVLAFFTDVKTQSETGNGFQVVYYPSVPPSTTSTTTEAPTTTTTPDPMTQCGEIFTSRFGNITYKENKNYSPNERCVWILRVPGAIRYDFSFITIDFSGEPADTLSILTLDPVPYPTNSYNQIRSPGKLELRGSVAIIVFASDSEVQKSGIFFTYEAIISENDISSESRDVILSGFPNDEVSHPVSGSSYSNKELSTFIVSPDFEHHPGSSINTEVTINGLESTCLCCDSIYVYKFLNEGGTRWALEMIVCSNSDYKTINHDDMLLFVFVSDEYLVDTGFNILFEVK